MPYSSCISCPFDIIAKTVSAIFMPDPRSNFTYHHCHVLTRMWSEVAPKDVQLMSDVLRRLQVA